MNANLDTDSITIADAKTWRKDLTELLKASKAMNRAKKELDRVKRTSHLRPHAEQVEALDRLTGIIGQHIATVTHYAMALGQGDECDQEANGQRIAKLLFRGI